MTVEPKWRRRKTARPGEIVAAALAVFAEKGFAAARLDDIAARAGVSKGALYLYFETKTDLFRAVVREAVAPEMEGARQGLLAFDGPFPILVEALFARIAAVIGKGQVGAVAKMVIGESRNFPDLARVWHEAVVSRVLGAMVSVIERAQARGEVRAGDPRLFAIQLVSPVAVSALWAEVFVPVGAEPVAVEALLAQHARTMARGMAPDASEVSHGPA